MDNTTNREGKQITKKTILVVEDDLYMNRLICNELSDRFADKVKAISFFNGKAAYDFFQKNHATVHLIISCIMMPEMDGIRLLRLCKEIDPRLPFVIYTATDHGDFAAGAEAFIAKSSDTSLLLNTIDKLLFAT